MAAIIFTINPNGKIRPASPSVTQGAQNEVQFESEFESDAGVRVFVTGAPRTGPGNVTPDAHSLFVPGRVAFTVPKGQSTMRIAARPNRGIYKLFTENGDKGTTIDVLGITFNIDGDGNILAGEGATPGSGTPNLGFNVSPGASPTVRFSNQGPGQVKVTATPSGLFERGGDVNSSGQVVVPARKNGVNGMAKAVISFAAPLVLYTLSTPNGVCNPWINHGGHGGGSTPSGGTTG
jgi:hypothetical protein